MTETTKISPEQLKKNLVKLTAISTVLLAGGIAAATLPKPDSELREISHIGIFLGVCGLFTAIASANNNF